MYLSFISDEYLFHCINNLFQSYLKARDNITKKKFYKNKIDSFKLTFDAKFNDLEEDIIIKNEINRQIDKSINNAIGTFHEEILGGVQGYIRGDLSGFDIKADDDTLFADIKNKHNTMNSSAAEALFQKLAHFADSYKQANCYWVQLLAKSSFCEHWKGDINGKEYSHSRVYKISGDQFYSIVTGDDEAFYKLYKILPVAIEEFLAENPNHNNENSNSALKEITEESKKSSRSLIDQITFDNFVYYKGFSKL